jgi:hypothetical protein
MTFFTFDASNRIVTSSGAISAYTNGLPFDSSGGLVVTDGTLAPSVTRNGIPFEASGAVAVHIGGTVASYVNGLPVTSNGRIVADSSIAVTAYSNGFPFSTAGLSLAGSAFDPLSYASILFWHDPSDAATITSSGGLVSQLNDKSGNTRHLTASTTARPTTGTATSARGLNWLDYNGTANILNVGGFTSSQPCTIYAVAKADTYIDGATIFSGNVQFPGEQLLRTTGNKWQIYADATVDGAVNDTAQDVHCVVFNGVSSAHYLNGVLSASGNAGSSILNGLSIGARPAGFAGSWWDGKIGEDIGYAAAHDATQRAAFLAYLSGKW